MSNDHEIAELIWENGHLSMHELGMRILPTAQRKAIWNGNGDTLESIVKQATSPCQYINIAETNHHQNQLGNTSSIFESYNLKCADNLKHLDTTLGFTNKRLRSEDSDQDLASRSARASASTTFCRDDETTLITWPFMESPPSLKTKSMAEDSACHDESETQDKEHETKREAVRSHTRRRSRDSDVHNQTERRRRDRINQKMKALQDLVPNANKTDKASVLDEVIAYLKQLQAQVQTMSVRNTPQMMMPLAMQQQQQQQQLQMNLLARMGMGVGPGMSMGMLDMTNLQRTAAAPNFIPPQFFIPPMMVPPLFQSHIPSQPIPNQGTTNTSAPINDPYCAFLAQSMNMELYNKMAAATTAAQYQEATHAAKEKGSNS